MTYAVPARAIALGLLAFAGVPGCASHVDVGFTSEGAAAIPDAGDASRAIQAMSADATDATDARGPACTFMKVCNDGGTRCPFTTVPAAWCNEVCQNSLDVCDNECVDLSSDPRNCGYCGRGCFSVETCVSGDCRR